LTTFMRSCRSTTRHKDRAAADRDTYDQDASDA